VTPLQHVQNERYRMMRSPVTTDQKWMNRNLVIFPPFSTPQGGERGANQNVPLTANSSQVRVECVGILGGGGRPLHCFGNTVRRKFKKKTFRRFSDQSLGHADTSSPRWVPNGIKRKRTQATPDRKSHGTRMDQVRKNYEKKKLTLFMKKKLISRTGIY
jgi:hypothetical protein